MKSILIILLSLLISGCGQIGGSSKGESQQAESKKEVTRAAIKTDLQAETHKALVNATGAYNTKIDVRVEGQLMEKMSGSQEKVAAESSVWAMSFSEIYSSYSSFMFIFIGIGSLLIVRAIRGFESTTTFKGMTGALRGLSSIASIGSEMLGEYNKNTPEWDAIKKYTDQINHKKSKLQSDLSEHHQRGKGFFN